MTMTTATVTASKGEEREEETEGDGEEQEDEEDDGERGLSMGEQEGKRGKKINYKSKRENEAEEGKRNN